MFLDEELTRFTNSLLWQSRFSRFVVSCSRIYHDNLGLDCTQVRILFLAAHCPREKVGFFCEVLSLRPSTVSMALSSLESMGYVTRMLSEKDARSFLVELTDKGYGVFPQLLDSFDEIRAVMDEDLKEGAFNFILNTLLDKNLLAVLSKKSGVDLLDEDCAYGNLRVDKERDPKRHLLNTALWVESAANAASLIGHAWSSSDLNMRTGRILAYCFLRAEEGETELGVSPIRDALLMRPAEVSSGVMKLEEMGLVSRSRNDSDRRMTIVSLTGKGSAVAKSALAKNLNVFEKVFFGLSEIDPMTCYRH